MATFRSYHSIENHYRRKSFDVLAKLALTNPTLEWIATEKVHGANFQFATDGKSVWCGKRTARLSEDDNFFGFQRIRDRYRSAVLEAFDDIQKAFPQMKQTIFFGELFGGGYPHKDVPHDPDAKLVQKNVYYCPHNDFYAFDIWTDSDGFLPYDTCLKVWTTRRADTKVVRFPLFAKALVRGTFAEVCSIDVERRASWIPSFFDLPAIEKNFIEGVVIRPVEVPLRGLYDLPELTIKKKARAFMEVTTGKTPPRGPIEKKMVPTTKMFEDKILPYVTKPRFDSVVSKIGHGGKGNVIYSAFLKDVLEEWKKDHEYEAFTKEQRGQFHRELNLLCSVFVEEQLKVV